jgi:hypothetical protein
VIVPRGYLTVLDALDKQGRMEFGKAWTGSEPAARSGLVSAEEFQLAKITPGEMRGGSGAGGITFIPDPDPLKRWPFGDPDSPSYQEERAARKRWIAVQASLLSALAHGERAAAALNRGTGRLVPIASRRWLQADAPKRLAASRTEHGHEILIHENRLAETLPTLSPPSRPEPVPAPPNDARPPWWPVDGQRLTEWVVAPATESEAERRLKEKGRPFTEGACCEAMEAMWIEAGRSTSEGSVARIRRRERA